jgi:hypothetical protein
MRTRPQVQAFLASLTLAAGLAGCGDDDVGEPIPNAKAQALLADLDAVQQDMDAGNCDEALAAIGEIRNEVDTLDDADVGADVQDALGDGVDTLGTLASDTCDRSRAPETTPETTPETIPPPVTETTPPPTTETTPPPTTDTTTTPLPPTEEPPDEGDGGAQFDPNAEIPPGQEKRLEDED